ncbi:MAG: alpha/beta fold hydrolase [Burkholderiaceae bacterium]
MSKDRIPDHSVTGHGDDTVFLLHGAFGAKEYWREQIAALSQAGYRVVAWDCPGYGCSPLPADFSVETCARALGRLLDKEAGPRNIVLGHSMGGMIAQRAYDYFGDRIHGLILSATSAAFGSPDGEWQRKFVADRVAPLDAGRSVAEHAHDFLPQMMAPGAAGPAVDLVVDTVALMRPETFRAAIVAITQYEGRAVLPKMKVPVLAIAGELDKTAPADVMAKMAGKIAGAEFVSMPGVAHFGWAEQPAVFNAHILDFLKRRLG